MPIFGRRSKNNLSSADEALNILFNEVIKNFDCTVLYGYRSPNEQFELFKRGREEINGIWSIVNKLEVVTNCDGYTKLSPHNKYPSKAVDVVPFPINWKDYNRMYMFVGFVKGIANSMNIPIRCGADWDGDTQLDDQIFHDIPHFELIY